MQPTASSASPNWMFATATVIWAMAAGIVARLTLVTTAPLFGGPSRLRWLESTPLGLSLSAAVIQLAMLGVVSLRGRLLPNVLAGLWQDLRHRKSRAGWALLLVLGLGPIANLAGAWVAEVTRSDLSGMQFVAALIRRATHLELVVVAIVLTVLPAIVEESLFRGLVQRSLAGARVSVVIGAQALAFGCFHLDVAQGVATTILGIGFGFIAQTTGSLAGSMVAHAAYNLLVLLSQRYLATSNAVGTLQWLELGVGAMLAGCGGLQLYRHRVREVGARS